MPEKSNVLFPDSEAPILINFYKNDPVMQLISPLGETVGLAIILWVVLRLIWDKPPGDDWI